MAYAKFIVVNTMKGYVFMDVEIKEKEPNTPSAKKIIGVQVTQDVYDALLRRSEEEWVSVSDILRRLIKKYLKGGK
jgi:uncharacterized protein YunC (DUF1805 family)